MKRRWFMSFIFLLCLSLDFAEASSSIATSDEDMELWQSINKSIRESGNSPIRARTSSKPVVKNLISPGDLVPKSVFILQDFADNYEHGLIAGGFQKFGEDLGAFEVKNNIANTGTSSVILETLPGGFTETNSEAENNFIGFRKVFTRPVDASPFSHLGYWAHSPKPIDDNGQEIDDNVRFFVIEIVIGDGGAFIRDEKGNIQRDRHGNLMRESGSLWVQRHETRLTLDTVSDGFERILVSLDEGFFQVQGVPTDKPDLTDLTEIIFLLLRWDNGGDDGTRTVYFDDIIFLNPPFDLKVRSDPVTSVPISGSLNGSTPLTRFRLADQRNITLTVDETTIVDGDGLQLEFEYWELNGDNQGAGVETISFEMLRDTQATAIYRPLARIVSVMSNLPNGVAIDGGSFNTSGVTGYTFNADKGTNISLVAPDQVDVGGTPYTFVRWDDNDGSQFLGSTLSVTVDDDLTVTATYELSAFILTVESSPPGFNISGTHTGTTNYSDAVPARSFVSLTAPERQIRGSVYRFNRWTRDDFSEPVGINTIDFNIDSDTKLVAEYILQYVLMVQSRDDESGQGIVDATITGSHGGITEYTEFVDTSSTVTLTAPDAFNIGPENYRFLQWEILGRGNQMIRDDTISFSVTQDTTVVAEYGKGRFVLTVESIPVGGVDITSSTGHGGDTDFVLITGDQENVNLVAPNPHIFPSGAINFRHWILTIAGQQASPIASLDIGVMMGGDTIATAVYDPVCALEPGWNFIATSLELENPNINEAMQSDQLMWKWEEQRFTTDDEMVPGIGYWVFSPERSVILLAGDEPNEFDIRLVKGWNMIGLKGLRMIMNPKHSDKITLPPNSKIVGEIWAWDPTNQRLYPVNSRSLLPHKRDRLYPSFGYWIYVSDKL